MRPQRREAVIDCTLGELQTVTHVGVNDLSEVRRLAVASATGKRFELITRTTARGRRYFTHVGGNDLSEKQLSRALRGRVSS